MNAHRILTLAGAALLLLLLAIGFRAYMAEHDARLLLKPELARQQAVIAKAQAERPAIEARRTAANQAVAALPIDTHKQQAELLNHYVFLHNPLDHIDPAMLEASPSQEKLPDEPGSLTLKPAQVREFAEFTKSCQQCSNDRIAGLAAEESLQRENAALRAQVAATMKVIRGGSRWQRVKNSLLDLGCQGAGAALGASLDRGLPARGAALGVGAGFLACSLAH